QVTASFGPILAQIVLIDIVFSLDSVITAVGMAKHIAVMIAAVVIWAGIMMVAARPTGAFVDRHPTLKMLALSSLILTGVMLVIGGLGQHVSKAYIYFAMGFSLAVEMVNLRVREASA